MASKKVKMVVEVNSVTHIMCDRCGNEFETASIEEGRMSHTTLQFGYGSILDNVVLELDICDTCWINILKDFKYKKGILE